MAGHIATHCETIVCSYAALNATSEAGKQVILPRMADRGKNGSVDYSHHIILIFIYLLLLPRLGNPPE
jgi:hypothetical protein